jgi:glutathione S-transferase
MRAKKVEFDVTYINLRKKPDWFLAISPRGLVPVLKVDDDILFESSAIAEYLDEVVAPRLHPEDPIHRARNRAWTDFAPGFASALTGGIAYARTRKAVDAGVKEAREALDPIEMALSNRGNDGPYFNGPDLSLVDCAYAPFLQRFTFVDGYLKTRLLDDYPLVAAWRDALLADERVTGAVPDNFVAEYKDGLRRRKAHVATLLEPDRAAAE